MRWNIYSSSYLMLPRLDCAWQAVIFIFSWITKIDILLLPLWRISLRESTSYSQCLSQHSEIPLSMTFSELPLSNSHFELLYVGKFSSVFAFWADGNWFWEKWWFIARNWSGIARRTSKYLTEHNMARCFLRSRSSERFRIIIRP